MKHVPDQPGLIPGYSKMRKPAVPTQGDSSTLYAAVLCLVLVGFSWLFVNVLAPHGLATSPDSFAYLEIAESIRDGHGVSLPDRSLEGIVQRRYQPVTVWPPLYPSVLAAFASGSSSLEAAHLVAALLLGLTLVFVFLILRELASSMTALLCSLLLCVTVPIMLDYSFVWSETLFLTLYTGLLWAATRFQHCDATGSSRRRPYLLVAAVLVAALFYTRYVGVFTPLLLVYLYCVSRHRKSDFGYFIAAGAMIGASILLLLYRNMLVSGSLSGATRRSADLSVVELMGHLVSTASVMLPSQPLVWLFCLVSSAVLVAFLTFRPGANPRSDVLQAQGRIVIGTAFVFVLLYTLTIIAMRYLSDFDSIGVRLLSPAFPALWIFLCALVFSTPSVHRLVRVAARGVAAIALTALCFQGWQFYGHIRERAAVLESPVYPYRKDRIHQNFTYMLKFGELQSLLTWNIARPAVVATSKPLRVEFLMLSRAVLLPRDFDMDFLDRLVAVTAPGQASLLLVTRREFDRFLHLSKEAGRKFETHRTQEGVLVLL